MTQTRYVELPNGIVMDANNIAYIIRAELNKYVIVPKRSISPNVPNLDGDELAALKDFLGVEKMPYVKPVVEEDKKSKIVLTGDDKDVTRV